MLVTLRSATKLTAVFVAILVGSLVFVRAEPSTAAGGAPRLERTATVAKNSPCDHPPVSRLAYYYPVRPFRRQHPIRGFFGDPRTVANAPFGEDTHESPGSFTFHNGVDIVAPTGTQVYPVVSGVVEAMRYADEVSISTNDARRFQYYHIKPRVRVGQRVIADRTVLGVVRPGWDHVHLTEIDVFQAHNPLDPGHLEPYRNHTTPSVEQLLFRAENGRDLDPEKLHGRLWIAADAKDLPPIPVPGEWYGFPVTPAFVAWRLTLPDGRLVEAERVVADFRHTEPDNRDFWRVYAAGTYQNFPVFAHHYYLHRPGRYLFNLTPQPLDTAQLADGHFVLTVDVADTCGNHGSISEEIAIVNHR